jgi:glutathione S-transferase
VYGRASRAALRVTDSLDAFFTCQEATMNPSAAARPAQPIRLHGFPLSGHSHRVQLFLSLLGLPYEFVPVNLAAGEQKRPAFLAMNAFGQVPVIEDGDVVLADSNAILVYLEARYAPGQWLPRDPVGAAQVQRWLSVAAGPLAFGPALARALRLFGRPDDPQPAMHRARGLLQVLEQQLAASPFLAGERPTLADLANYSYVAHAPEGGVDLEGYPQVRAWVARIEALPGFVGMPKSALPKAA